MAEKDFLVHADGNLNELQNWKYQQLATDPVSPVEGQFWWNTTDNRLKHYDGTQTKTVAVLSDITSSIKFKGGYDAAANTPDLEAPGTVTIKQGDFYYVTVAGTFYTEAVEIGDALIANVDNAASLSDWTRVQFNVDQATESVRGVAEIATQTETDAGTDDSRIVTPKKLTSHLSTKNYTRKFAVDLDNAESTVVRVFAGGVTTFTVTHSLNEADVQIEIREIVSGKTVLTEVDEIDANTVDIAFNGSVADNIYRISVIG